MKNAMAAVLVGIVILAGSFLGLRYFGNQGLMKPGSLNDTSENPNSALVNSSPATPMPGATRVTLTVTSPTNGATVTTSSLVLRGKTSPRAEVFVNELETRADANGNFSVSVTLDEGENYLIVTANDENGNVAEAEVTVTYNP